MNFFEEVGLLPEVFDREHYESLLHQEMALGRLLQRLRITTWVRAVEEPKWTLEAKERCRTSLPAQKVLQTLAKERRIISEAPTAGKDFPDWPSRFEESHKLRELCALISDDLFGSDTKFRPQITNISKVIAEDWWSDLTLNTEVEGSEEFVAVIRLPLTRAARIELVDPWLLPTKDQSKRLLELIVTEVVRNPSVSAFKIHSSFKALRDHPQRREKSFWRSRFEHISEQLANSNRSARVFIWDHRDLPDKFHDRYLLTELGSCGIGKGFDVEKGVKTRFYRLDRETNRCLESVFRADENSQPKPYFSFRIGTIR